MAELFDTEGLKSVAQLRENLAMVSELLTRVQQRIAQSEDGMILANLQGQLQRIKTELVDAEKQVRDAALAYYGAYGEKKPAPGVEIKIYKGAVVLTNPVAALEWAKRHMPVAVKEVVDEKALLAYVTSITEDYLPLWAERTSDKPQCTLAKDLSMYLQED